MSNFDQYDDENDDQQPEPNSTLRQLRAELKARDAELDTLRAQAERTAELEKENAFLNAGLPTDLSETRRKAILATAEASTPEGFRKAAEELGFVDPPQPVVNQDELGAHDRATQAMSGGEVLSDASYEAELAAARSQDEVLAIMAKYGSPVAKYD